MLYLNLRVYADKIYEKNQNLIVNKSVFNEFCCGHLPIVTIVRHFNLQENKMEIHPILHNVYTRLDTIEHSHSLI